MAAPAGKLSFVLPVALREQVNGRWRDSPDEGALRRTHLTLASFVKNFRQEDLLDFCVICPTVDLAALTQLLKSVTRDGRYRIADESELCPEILRATKTNSIGGWYTQQLIKLDMAKNISSAHYVTLDSDILCVKPFSHADLVVDGRALTNVETNVDYERLYVSKYCQRELITKQERYRGAAKILGYDRPSQKASQFYGETPVVLHTQSVLGLTQFLSERFRQPWIEGLAAHRQWTEYSLYFQFLEMTGQLESVCFRTNCNGVLDLEKSVWLLSEGYRRPRSYDARHFTTNLQATAGFFVAVQSWLAVHKWLPARFKNLQEFYDEVEVWLNL